MITGSEIYWITRFDALRMFVFVFGGITVGLSTIGLLISCIYHAINTAEAENYSSNKNLLPISRKCIRIFILCLFATLPILATACFIPTTKEMCAIKIIPKIVSNEEVQELPEKVVELANEWLEELRPQKPTE